MTIPQPLHTHKPPPLRDLKGTGPGPGTQAPHSTLFTTTPLRGGNWIHGMVFPPHLDPVTIPKRELVDMFEASAFIEQVQLSCLACLAYLGWFWWLWWKLRGTPSTCKASFPAHPSAYLPILSYLSIRGQSNIYKCSRWKQLSPLKHRSATRSSNCNLLSF